MKKNTQKAFKPAFKVNLVNCYTAEELEKAFIYGKYEAGLSLTPTEYCKFAGYEVDEAIDCFVEDLFEDYNSVYIENGNIIRFNLVAAEKKQPWYKRLWNRITGKK